MEKINIAEKLGKIRKLWSPRIIASPNGQNVMLAKGDGEFVWHSHRDQDEFFLVLEGLLRIRMKGRKTIELKPGEAFMVPRGVEHKTVSVGPTSVMLFEPAETKHTGERMTRLTVKRLRRI